MAKRIQVTIQDAELWEIQRAAEARQMSVADWVREVLDRACRRERLGEIAKRIAIIRAAAQHDYPVSDIEGMLREIEKGYGAVTRP